LKKEKLAGVWKGAENTDEVIKKVGKFDKHVKNILP
jgi:hypothetical protein